MKLKDALKEEQPQKLNQQMKKEILEILWSYLDEDNPPVRPYADVDKLAWKLVEYVKKMQGK